MLEKDQLEQKFWRFGNKSKTKSELQEKRVIEEALEKSSGMI